MWTCRAEGIPFSCGEMRKGVCSAPRSASQDWQYPADASSCRFGHIRSQYGSRDGVPKRMLVCQQRGCSQPSPQKAQLLDERPALGDAIILLYHWPAPCHSPARVVRQNQRGPQSRGYKSLALVLRMSRASFPLREASLLKCQAPDCQQSNADDRDGFLTQSKIYP